MLSIRQWQQEMGVGASASDGGWAHLHWRRASVDDANMVICI